MLKTPGADAEIRRHIEGGVRNRLDTLYGDTEDLSQLTDTTITILRDIPVIKERVIPCFPESVIQESDFIEIYRKKIEGKILPFLTEMDRVREHPGTLVLIAAWLEMYCNEMEHFFPELKTDANILYLNDALT